MAILSLDLDRLSETYLLDLVEASASESMVLEFKAEPYGPKDDNKREFLKDITALANYAGGNLIIGIEETGGVATALHPIVEIDADKMQLHLTNLLQNGVEPRIFGVQMKAVTIDDGYVLVIRVPPSFSAPHRVTSQGSNRFYLRSPSNAYEASYTELRNMFIQNANAAERVKSFRQARLDIINLSTTAVQLNGRFDRLVVHILSLAMQNFSPTVDLIEAQKNESSFRQMGESYGYSSRINIDGFAVFEGGLDCRSYTQLFRTGELEAVYVGCLNSNDNRPPFIFAPRIEKLIFERLHLYFQGLKTLGSSPPFFVCVSLQNVRGKSVVIGQNFLEAHSGPPLHVDDLLLPVCVIEDYGDQETYQQAMKPALDALWNGAGIAEWSPSTSS